MNCTHLIAKTASPGPIMSAPTLGSWDPCCFGRMYTVATGQGKEGRHAWNMYNVVTCSQEPGDKNKGPSKDLRRTSKGPYAHMQILVVQIRVNLKRFFGHNSAPWARIGLKIGGKASQQCRPPSYNPEIPRKQRLTPQNLQKTTNNAKNKNDKPTWPLNWV